MRYFLLPITLVAACAMSSATQAEPGAVTLVCPETPEPAVTRLCGALAQALRAGGYRLEGPGDAAKLRLLVAAEVPQPGLLRARLVVERDGSRHTGEQGELWVTDRRDIPPERIDRFARDLLAQAPLSRPR